MHKAPIPENEKERQADVDALNIVDTAPEAKFDRLTELATKTLNAPMSTLTIIDNDREWYKSYVGLDDREGPRATAFCAQCIVGDGIFILPDTKKDDRYKNNPYVTGEPHVRFYAGVPLRGPKGYNVGSLCVMDTKPREMTEEQKSILKDLAYIAELDLNRFFENTKNSGEAEEQADSYLKGLEIFRDTAVEREAKMAELKKEIKRLKEE